MTAHKTGEEVVPLGGKIGGDEGKDVQREAVDGNERVLPFANCRQRGRGVTIKLRDVIQGDTT